MTTAEFLAYLRRLGVEVSGDGERPRVIAPRGVLTPQLREELIARSEEIAAFLGRVRATHRPQAPPLVPVDRDRPLPLSFAQQRLWFLARLEPDRTDYNAPIAMRLTGPLNVAALRQALTEVVSRHEVLRTTFAVTNGVPHQVIAPPAQVRLPVTDLSGPGGDKALREAERLIAADAGRPFDLAHGPVLRCALLRLAADDHILGLTLHHIAADDWSIEVLNGELSTLYEALRDGQPSPLPPLPVQYADFAVWQRSWLDPSVLEERLAYWRDRLVGLSTLELPVDRRPPRRTSTGGVMLFEVRQAISDRLYALARRHGATMFMALLAAFKVLLARYCGQDDVAVGTMIANRERSETQGLVGFFANTLVLRTDLSGDPTFAELLGRVREVALGAYAHQDVPFERLVEDLAPARDLTRTPLFQVMFTYQTASGSGARRDRVRGAGNNIGPALAGTRGCAVSLERTTALFDLTLAMGESAGRLRGGLEYSTDLFEPATAERFADHLQHLLAAVAAAPDAPLSAIHLPDDEEGWRLAPSPTGTGVPVDEPPVYRQVERHAADTPDAVAIVAGNQRLTYRQLDTRANQLAHRLRALGVGPEVLVALCLDRTVELAVAILAVWKAGGAYLPLDPEDPPERLAALLADAGAALAITQRGRLDTVQHCPRLLPVDEPDEHAAIARQPATPPPCQTVPLQALAYTIYTSGSTGGPKGVAVTHANLTQLVAAWRDAHRSQEARHTWLTTASAAFDVFSGDWLRALTGGGALVIAPTRLGLTPARLIDVVDTHGVTALECSPAVLATLLDHLESAGRALPTVRLLVVATDTWMSGDRDRARNLLGPNIRMMTAFGLTETSVDSTFFDATTVALAPDQVVPIGHPLTYTTCYVLDRTGRPMPLGVPGELYVGGPAVARGYAGRPTLTAERFLADPFAGDGSRMYRTGDRVRRQSGGALEFLGRIDEQANIRGHRVEPGEVEAALRGHPEVADAAVVAQPEPGLAGQRRLIAYVVTRRPAAPVGGGELRSYLAGRLPGHLVPSLFVPIDAMPRTRNGKLDRRALDALPDPQTPQAVASGSAYPTAGGGPPATPTEEIVAGIWADLLGVERVAATDDFFDLGGHSMLAAQVAWRLIRTTGVELPLVVLFEATTVRALATAVEAAQRRTPSSPIVPVPRDGSGSADAPLSFAQQRLWLLAQLEPDSVEYNVPAAVRLSGPLDVSALHRSLDEIVARHEVMRTSFVAVDGVPRQVVASAAPIPLPVVDLSDLPPETATAQARRLVAEQAMRPFDLAHDQLVRATLLRIDENDHILTLTLHHIVCDEWSTGILQRELSAIYAAFRAGQPSPLAPLPVQYADFASWQHRWLRDEELNRQQAYWRAQLEDLPALELPADRARPPVRTVSGAMVDFSVPREVADRLRAVSRRHDATLFMTLLAAFQLLLARYTGQQDVAVGTLVAGRSRPETEDLIGFFVNTLVLRTDLSGDPAFAELLARARGVVLGAFAHQDLPFERLVEQLQPARDRSRTPLFSVMFTFTSDTAATAAPIIGPAQVCDFPVDFAVAQFDLTLTMADHGESLGGVLEYSTALFDRSTIDRLASHLVRLLADVAEHADRPLSRLSLLPEAERQQLLAGSRGATLPIPADRVDELVTMHARNQPEVTAVAAAGERWTFAALERRANQLAWHLRSLGVGPEVVVGVYADRGPQLLVGLLGVLKAGGAYLPLDPAYPVDRLRFMVADARAAVVCMAGDLADAVPFTDSAVARLDAPAIDALPPDPPGAIVEPGNLAYVMYTSGSTGTPKGVMVSHANLRQLLVGWVAAHGLDQPPEQPHRWLSLASPSFDVFSGDWIRALCTGGTLVLGRSWLAADSPQLASLLAEAAVTALEVSPMVLAGLVGEASGPPPGGDCLTGVRLLIVASDPWYGAEAARLTPLLPPGTRTLTAFGITETTIDSTWWDGPLGDLAANEAAPIGRPLPNTCAYVLDGSLQPAPVGVPGDLYIGGAGVARGYAGRPDLTAQRFVADPFAANGSRMYRTGDRVRWRSRQGSTAQPWLDTNLEFLGRTDEQVRLRGHRIEPGEVQAALLAHPAIAQAAVGVRGGAISDQSLAGAPEDAQRLVAWLVPVGGARPPGIAELRAFLAQRLPEYLLPASYQFMTTMPLTPNGKVDRRALPTPDSARPALESGYLTPRTTTERVLVDIWSALLGIDRVGSADNFFELGGHSLLAMQVVSRARTAFGIELELSALFAAPVLADLAAAVEAARGSQPGPRLRAVPRTQRMPLSFAQQRLWVLDQLDPGSAEYNVPSVLRLRGPLDLDALRQALSELVARHEVLRARFVAPQGTPYLVVVQPAPVELPVTDLSGSAGEQAAVRTQHWVNEETATPFDLSEGPLLRAAVLRYDECDHLLAVTMHHIVCDEWSTAIVQRELTTLYRAFSNGEPSPLAPLPIQYADFAIWQRAWLRGDVLDRQLAYWRAQLDGVPPLELPTDRPRPAFRSTAGAAVGFAVPHTVLAGLRKLSRDRGATLFMTLLAAFQVVLGRRAGQSDVAVGTPLAGRVRSETEDLVGFFVNTLVLRTDLSADPSFNELLERVRQVALGAYAHQDLPFERLVEELVPHRDLSRTPLFQVLFNLEQALGEAGTPQLGGLELGDFPVPCLTTNFDLTLTAVEQRDELSCTVEYNTALFEQSTVERLSRQLTRLLAEVVDNPDQRLSQLAVLLPEERAQVLRAWNDTDVPVGPGLVHELIAEQAGRRPDHVAVVGSDEQLTYAELERRANQLAHHLRSLGVGPETVVGLYLERSAAMVIGMLGVLKSGGAYLPIDPGQPAARVGSILADARAAVLLTQHELDTRPPTDAAVVCIDDPAIRARLDGLPEHQLPDGPSAGNLAYVIYTSGSTGTPKGVLVQHANLRNILASMASAPGMGPGDVLLSVTTPSFDIAALELLLPLQVGATVRLGSRGQVGDPALLGAALAETGGVTVMQATPATWRMLVESGWPGRPHLRALCGGEALDAALAADLSARTAAVWNLYGPTETTIWSTLQPLPITDMRAGTAPIGRPVANTRVYVLDEYLQPAAVNVPGELYIAGAGVARGYAGRPELTAQRFVADPFGGDGGRMYRTGDRVRWRSDGRLEFLGRTDAQVKVRGYRVEPAEVEAALSMHPAVATAAVVARDEGTGQRQLVAHLVNRSGATLDVAALRGFLGQRLPEYMIPTAFIVQDSLPHTPNGKVDRRALRDWPDPRLLPALASVGDTAPRTSVERTLAGLWATLLGLDRVGTADDFFELGGHSLLATQLVSRVRSAFGVELALRAVFEAPTVAGLAALVASGELVADEPVVPVVRDGTAPLSFAQQRLWVLDQLEPGSGEYNVSKTLRLSGPLDLPALERALSEMVRRHETLRTTFDSQLGVPRQVIAVPEPVALPLTDLSHLDVGEAAAQALRLVANEATRPFNLDTGPLLRGSLVRLGAHDHVLALVMHHIVCDEWSLRTVERELALLYAAFSVGGRSPLAPLAVQYADFAVWQRARLRDDLLESQLAYWRDRLAGVRVLELPTDRLRPPVRCPDGDTVGFTVSAGDVARLRVLSRQEGVTTFMALLAAFQAVLSRWAGQADVVVGTPVAGRTRLEVEDLVGCFVNTLVLRVDLSGDPSFTEILQRVREVALGAYAHQDLPFERLVEQLQPERDRSRTPLFQVIFNFEAAADSAAEPAGDSQSTGLEWCEMPPSVGTAKFDLRLSLVEGNGVLSGAVEYSTALFDRSTMERFARHFAQLLTAVVADPGRRLSEVALMSAAERRQLVVDWAAPDRSTRTPQPSPGQLVHELVAAQAAHTPDATAVVAENCRLTYVELETRANKLARHLRAFGVGPDVVVGLCLDRGAELLVSLLAVLKSGGAYLPLDPREPLTRLAGMLDAAGAAVVITQERLSDRLPAGRRTVLSIDDPDEAALVAAHPDSAPASGVTDLGLAYVLFTSGSTGSPKGVAVTHRGLAAYVEAARHRLGLAPNASFGLAQSLSVDFGITMLFPALVSGGQVHLLSHEEAADAERFADYLARHPLDYLKLVPSHLAALGRAVDVARLLPRRALVLGGEPAPLPWARELAARLPAGTVHNHYGPTEATVGATTWQVAAEARPEERGARAVTPIGQALPHVRCYVLDPFMQPVPVGLPGELLIGGCAVARGYLGRPDLTAERFVPDPFVADGGRLYRTGDRVRWRPDRTLEFLGRLDAQLKVRGFRVEPAEVEAALVAHPAVAQAAVCLEPDESAPSLIAYLVPDADVDLPLAGELRRFLTAYLPDPLVPTRFTAVEALPLTAAGKIDRRALAGRRGAAVPTGVAFVPPSTPTEQALAGIWRELLGTERVGIDDDFFDLGGHSLLATQVISRIRAGFDVEPALATLFDHPSLGQLANAIDTLVWAADTDLSAPETVGPDREEIAL